MSKNIVSEMIERARTVHTAIADDLCPDGKCGQLICRAGCGKEQPIDASDVARYLRHGWPRCCGRQMRWIRNQQARKQATAGTT